MFVNRADVCSVLGFIRSRLRFIRSQRPRVRLNTDPSALTGLLKSPLHKIEEQRAVASAILQRGGDERRRYTGKERKAVTEL